MNKHDQKCNICGFESCEFIADLVPYTDMDWTFDIYDCPNCGIRFAIRNPSINYHEILHDTQCGGYMRQYLIADNVKLFLQNGKIRQCERYLKNTSVIYSKIIDFIKSRSKTSRILEIGCSTGFITAFIRSLGYDIEGTDISGSAIKYATENFGHYYHVPPIKKKYDLMIHSGLIGCVEDPRSFIYDYMDLLNSDGIMYFNAPNVDSIRKTGRLWASTTPPDLIFLFNEKSFRFIFDNIYYRVDCSTLYKNRRLLLSTLSSSTKQASPQGKRYFRNVATTNKQKNNKRINKFINRMIVQADNYLTRLLPSHLQQEHEYGLMICVKKHIEQRRAHE